MTPRPPRPRFLLSFLFALLISLLLARGALLLAGLPALRGQFPLTPVRLHQLTGAARFAVAATVVLLFAAGARSAWRAVAPGAPRFHAATLAGAGVVVGNHLLEFIHYAALYFFRCRLAMDTLVRGFDLAWLAVGLGGIGYLFRIGARTALPWPVHAFWLTTLAMLGLRLAPFLM